MLSHVIRVFIYWPKFVWLFLGQRAFWFSSLFFMTFLHLFWAKRKGNTESSFLKKWFMQYSPYSFTSLNSFSSRYILFSKWSKNYSSIPIRHSDLPNPKKRLIKYLQDGPTKCTSMDTSYDWGRQHKNSSARVALIPRCMLRLEE